MLISHKARTISPSPTLAIDAKAKQMKGEGHDVLDLELVNQILTHQIT